MKSASNTIKVRIQKPKGGGGMKRNDNPYSKPGPEKKLNISMGLEVIPPNESDPESLHVLAAVDTYFFRNKARIKRDIQKWVEKKTVTGLRPIQGDRHEIFVRANADGKPKPTGAFDVLIQEIIDTQEYDCLQEKTVEDVRSILLNYAEQQARLDPRIGDAYEFDNFSFLVNYQACEAQFPHIDLLYPNIQCGLCLTDKVPATLTYTTPHPIHSVEDLKTHCWPDMPPSLVQAMRDCKQCTELLEQFGDTLTSSDDLVEVKQRRLLKRGSVLTLPGSVIHAGPRATGYRCLLFFSGWRKGSSVASYHPDTQYFRPLLCCDLFAILYHKVTFEDRMFLIRKLDPMLSSYKNLYRHLNDEAMVKFTRALGWAQYGAGGKEQLIDTFAKGLGVIPKGDGGGSAGALTQKQNKNEGENLKLASVEGLQTEWEGQAYGVQIFRCPDDSERVYLYYPTEKEWEGKKPKERYTLVLTAARTTRGMLFDGSNGVLKDSEGVEIQCFRMGS